MDIDDRSRIYALTKAGLEGFKSWNRPLHYRVEKLETGVCNHAAQCVSLDATSIFIFI
ncbi:hypothetical protein [Mesorhizobium sp.]|uniref:hypothetical protein n=1 Tax=Mesorhizobium sp. TaxID=1871066 RepID=UPI00257F4F45|nr:hypothetical protein [Mesorhizobium sp.]